MARAPGGIMKRFLRRFGLAIYGVRRVLFPVLGSVAVLRSGAATFQDDFANPPSTRGWKIFGEASLFHWNPDRQQIEVTWDSRQPNSYFFHSLGTVLTSNDDFSLAFDLCLDDIAIGSDPNQPFTFELAIGLMNFGNATNATFARGSGIDPVFGPKNLVEFDYFPDSGFGATVAPTVVSTNNRIKFSDNHPLELTPGDCYQVTMNYTASNRVLHTDMRRNDEPFGLPPSHTLADLLLTDFVDFRVDTFSLSSFNGAHADGSILAHAAVDNIVLTLPPLPVTLVVGSFVNQAWQVSFEAQGHWLYLLERTEDFQAWRAVSPSVAGVPGRLVLQDTQPLPGRGAFYRVRAERK
jgi:hypothetical protein